MAQRPPHYELRRVFADGTATEPEIVPLSEFPSDAIVHRRGFLGAGIAFTAIAGAATPVAPAEGASSRRSNKRAKGIRAHKRSVVDLEFSIDDSFLVSASRDGTAKIWNFTNEVRSIEHKSPVTNVAVSPSGTRIATSCNDRKVRIATRQGLVERTLVGHKAKVNGVEFLSADRLASASSDKTIRVWDVNSGTLVKILEEHEADVYGLARIPDGEQPLFVSASADKTVAMWDGNSDKSIARLTGHEGAVVDVKVFTNGSVFVTRSQDLTLGIWSVQKRALVRRLSSSWGNVRAIAIGPENDRIATAKSRSIKVWSVPDGKLLYTLEEHMGQVICLAYSHDGTRLACGDSHGAIYVWNTATRKLEGTLFDTEANTEGNDGISYTLDVGGRVVTYTLPCGSPIPPNATCVCNCVPGSLALQHRYVPRNRTINLARRRYNRVPIQPLPRNVPPSQPTWRYYPRYGGTICTCNKVCICMAV